MMEGYHGLQYQLQSFGEQKPSVPNMATTRSSHRLSTGAASEPDTSFDSGFLSPSKTASFTGISSNPRGTGLHSPAKVAGSSAVGELLGRTGWSEEMPLGGGVTDDWDRHFINNFQENLFGFDAADLNSMVDGMFRSPFKSPQGSPYKSPRQTRSAVAGLGLSPFKNQSTSNVMLSGPKRSPVHFGSSFKSPFSTPSPGKSGFNPYTSSPLTRQRRLILQTPDEKSSDLATVGDPFPELPELLADIKEEIGDDDDLGVVPFQRHNSFGFVPQEDSPPSFSDSFSGLAGFAEDLGQPSSFPYDSLPQVHGKKGGQRVTPRKRISTPRRATSTAGKSSITTHSQVITTLNSKDALRLVRASFKEILDRATQDAILKERNIKQEPATGKKPAQYPEITSALSKPIPKGGGRAQDPHSVQNYGKGQSHRGGKRRHEIRPKPGVNMQISEPVRIAPKKRKR